MGEYGTRKCLVCGKEFEAAYASELCCSVQCKKLRQARQKAESNAKRGIRWKNLMELEDRVKKLEEIVFTAHSVSDQTMKVVGGADAAEECTTPVNTTVDADIRDGNGTGECAEDVEQQDADGDEQDANTQEYEEEAAAETGSEPETNHDPYGEPELTLRPGVLRECKRMNLKAAKLPCGWRPECFNPRYCDNVPAGASYIGYDDVEADMEAPKYTKQQAKRRKGK